MSSIEPTKISLPRKPTGRARARATRVRQRDKWRITKQIAALREAGRVVVAYHQGGRVELSRIYANNDNDNNTAWEGITRDGLCNNYNRSKFLVAGIMSEALFAERPSVRYRSTDYKRIKGMTKFLADEYKLDQMVVLNMSLKEAAKLLMMHQNAVWKIAGALTRCERLGEEEIAQILGPPKNGAPVEAHNRARHEARMRARQSSCR